MPQRRFSPFAFNFPNYPSTEIYNFEKLVGGHRYIEIEDPDLIEEVPGKYIKKIDTYDNCYYPFLVYRTKKEITLIAIYSLGGRMFTPNPLQIVLPAGSDICLVPTYHSINRVDSSACLAVIVNE